MIFIESLGSQVVLPAFVIGYDYVSDDLREIDGLPEWLVAIDHQVEGYGTALRLVAGVVLRLEANRERGFVDLSALIRGLKAMAEDPDPKILKDYPLLQSMVYTCNDPYSREKLNAFEEYLSGFVRIPPIESGVEAYISHVRCNPLDYFAGWKMMGCRVRPEAAGRTYFADGYIDELEFFDAGEYGEDIQNYLSQFWNDVLQFTAPPRVFLMWENSD